MNNPGWYNGMIAVPFIHRASGGERRCRSESGPWNRLPAGVGVGHFECVGTRGTPAPLLTGKIMGYEKKYKEALERAKMILCNLGEGSGNIRDIENIFPELRESEDERILRVISEAVITFFSDYANDFEDEDRDAALAYLEKQKEQKPEWSEEDDQLIGFIFDLLNDLVWRKDWAMSKEECLERLKSLRPSWKPSEEHLSALLAVFNDPNNIGSQTCQLALTDLYEQLKKL